MISILVTLLIHIVYPLNWLGGTGTGYWFPYHFLITGPVEETAKFLCFLAVVHSIPAVKEPQDGVLMGAAVGMGFGTIENIFYIYEYPEIFIAIRPLLTTGGHMIYGAIWGGMYSSALYSNIHSRDPQAYRVAIGGVLFVALIHGLYNSVPFFALRYSSILLLSCLQSRCSSISWSTPPTGTSRSSRRSSLSLRSGAGCSSIRGARSSTGTSGCT